MRKKNMACLYLVGYPSISVSKKSLTFLSTLSYIYLHLAMNQLHFSDFSILRRRLMNSYIGKNTQF